MNPLRSCWADWEVGSVRSHTVGTLFRRRAGLVAMAGLAAEFAVCLAVTAVLRVIVPAIFTLSGHRGLGN